jgi:hypothetical protein
MATQYVGNNDYRGYLNYLSQNGDQNATALLGLVGNDGNFSNGEQFMAPYSADINNANATFYSNFVNGGSTGGGTAAGSGVQDTSAADLAYLDDQEGSLRGMLGSAQNTLNNGLTQIGDSYNKETGRTNEAKANATEGFITKREDTTRGKLAAVGQVNTGARTLADSVRRMLGLASGQNSSAFRETAPGAIARDASIKRTGVNETYGRNFRDLNTAEESTDLKFEQYLQDLAEQKRQKEQGLREGVLTQEQGIYNDLGDVARQRAQIQGGDYNAIRSATAPARTAIADRQTALDSLFNTFRTPYATKDVAVDAPVLGDYTVDPTALKANNQTGGADAQYSPYSQFLKKKFAAPVA